MHRWLSLIRVFMKNKLVNILWKLQVLCRYWKSAYSTFKLQCYDVQWLRSSHLNIAGNMSVLLWASLGSRAHHFRAGFVFLVGGNIAVHHSWMSNVLCMQQRRGLSIWQDQKVLLKSTVCCMLVLWCVVIPSVLMLNMLGWQGSRLFVGECKLPLINYYLYFSTT